MIIADRDAHGEASRRFLRESGAQALFISCNIAEKTQVGSPVFPGAKRRLAR
ncbi:hypothetical protein LNP74_32225 [Klebsiella pneumoniae subsp. pneumoniae]|nr:hypothetical protein [Klebsiella pneumoniae subsp. pneumoniae]